MFPWIVVLAILGLVMLFAEILMPGFGLFGILGTISLFGSLVLTYRLYGMVTFLIMLAAMVVIFFAMVYVAKKSGLYNKVILKDKQEAKDFDESVLQGLLGQVGITQSTLRPFGVAEFDGKMVDVCSQGDFIDRGEKVQVVQITGKTVTVKTYTE
ncbi:MAG: NfeD family protein [Anaerotignum sp.]